MQTQRVYESAMYLIDILHKVPMHVIPCVEGRPPAGTPVTLLAGYFGSIFPAVWSFQLAARSRGLGTVLTTLHLLYEKEAADILGVPDNVSRWRCCQLRTRRAPTSNAPSARPLSTSHTGTPGEMISASLVDANTYEVVVSGDTETVHRVRMSPDYYRKLSGAQFTHEWVLIQAFQFLLEREPNTSILKEFDLSVINRYFPEFEDDMAARLGR